MKLRTYYRLVQYKAFEFLKGIFVERIEMLNMYQENYTMSINERHSIETNAQVMRLLNANCQKPNSHSL